MDFFLKWVSNWTQADQILSVSLQVKQNVGCAVNVVAYVTPEALAALEATSYMYPLRFWYFAS